MDRGLYLWGWVVLALLVRYWAGRRRSARAIAQDAVGNQSLAEQWKTGVITSAQADHSQDEAMRREVTDMSNTNVTYELLSRYLDAGDLAHDLSRDGKAIEAGFAGKTGLFKVSVILWGDDPLRLFVSVRIPIVVPEKHRLAMAEAVTRANFGMTMGGFEMEMGAGFLGYRADMPVADGTVTEEQFRILLGGAMATADRYFPAFLRLIYGDDLSPAEVVAEVEMEE
jgi:hypothetical protein